MSRGFKSLLAHQNLSRFYYGMAKSERVMSDRRERANPLKKAPHFSLRVYKTIAIDSFMHTVAGR